MLDRALWIGGIVLESTLLVRSVWAKLFTKFPFFYIYILVVLLQSLMRLAVYQWHRDWYMEVYWYTEFVAVVAGCLVLFEIYWKGLSPYPGTARLARNLLALVMIFASAKAVVGANRGRVWWPAQTTAELERNLRAVQAVAILALVILLLAYLIPLGRNLRGIILGYGLFLTTRLISLAALAYLGSAAERVWWNSQQVFYFFVLCIWNVALWSPSSQPGLGVSPEAAASYSTIAQATRERLKRARFYFRGKKDR